MIAVLANIVERNIDYRFISDDVSLSWGWVLPTNEDGRLCVFCWLWDIYTDIQQLSKSTFMLNKVIENSSRKFRY